jgi:hypothetical protein
MGLKPYGQARGGVGAVLNVKRACDPSAVGEMKKERISSAVRVLVLMLRSWGELERAFEVEKRKVMHRRSCS